MLVLCRIFAIMNKRSSKSDLQKTNTHFMEEINSYTTNEKPFTPVRRTYSRMIWTFAYFVGLHILFYTYTVFSRYTSLRPSLVDAITSINFFNYHFLFSLLSFSLSVTLVIHKSYLKGLIALAVYPAILLLPNLQGDLGFFVFLSVLVTLPILFAVASLSILVRGIFRIKKKWLRLSLVVLPFVIFAMLFPLTYLIARASLSNGGVEYCDTLVEIAGEGGSSQKANCYYQVAVEEGDPQICLKISGGVENTNLQTPCLVNTFIDSDDLVIDSNYCRTNMSEKYFKECVSALAILRNDICVCDINLPQRSINFCHNMFKRQEDVFNKELVPECPQASEPVDRGFPKPVSLAGRLVYSDSDYSSSKDKNIRSDADKEFELLDVAGKKLALPELIDFLDEKYTNMEGTDFNTVSYAAFAIAKIGPEAKEAAPALIKAFKLNSFSAVYQALVAIEYPVIPLLIVKTFVCSSTN